jgi:hypothetical protein
MKPKRDEVSKERSKTWSMKNLKEVGKYELFIPAEHMPNDLILFLQTLQLFTKLRKALSLGKASVDL